MTILLMCGLALIGAMPVFLLVASLTRTSVTDGKKKTQKFLKQWGGIAPPSLKVWIRTTIGTSVGFSFLVALTFAFNLLGDQRHVTPAFSKAFGHFGNPYTEWSVTHAEEWDAFREKIKGKWAMRHPDENLVLDKKAFEEWKNARGKEQVRIPRTLIWFSVLLLAAGLYDLSSARYRRRGILIINLGAVSFVLLMSIWADRKNSYVRNVVTTNETLGDFMVPVPRSLETTLQKSNR